MNRFVIALTYLSFFFTLQGAAQESGPGRLSESRLAKAEKNYLACLSSENNGVVESGIAMAARLRVIYPERDLPGFREKLHELAMQGRTSAIRYKAYLVTSVLEDRALIASAGDIATLDNNELFTLIATRMQSTLLGYSGQ